MNILAALRSRRLFGALPVFRQRKTWSAWETFLAASYGLELDADGQERFCRHTGRSTYNPPAGGFPRVVLITGRQSGKSRIAAMIADFEGILSAQEPDRTELYALLIAQDQRASLRTLFRYAAAPFDLVTMLQKQVVSQTSGAIALKNGLTIAAYPCRPAAVRGLRARVVVLDELAFYRSSSTENLPVDVEMLRAVTPTLASTGGKLVILSSPYGSTGALFEIHRRHWGHDDSDTMVWVATAPEMNPTLPANYLRRMEIEDPEAYRSEVLGEFRTGVANLFDPDALAACVANRRENPPKQGVRYTAFCDASSGRKDAFTAAIAHAEDERVIVDVCRAWRNPNPRAIVTEVADLAKRYECSTISGDRYSIGFVVDAFAEEHIRFEPSPLDRSGLYLSLLYLANAGTVELPNDEKLLRELRGLQRMRGSSGKDRVDHPRGQHDDLANACAGAAVLAQEHRTVAADMSINTSMESPSYWGNEPAGSGWRL